MNLLIFFSIVFAVIIFAVILQRIINCPTLVGFAFFAIFLVVAAVLNNISYVLGAIGLGILAFIVAFLDCVFRNSRFFRNNSCLRCNGDDSDNNNENGRSGGGNSCCNCNCGNNDDETLRIVNSDGVVIARIDGNTIRCRNNENNNGCGCSCNSGNSVTLSEGNVLVTNDMSLNSSNCGNCNRSFKYNR